MTSCRKYRFREENEWVLSKYCICENDHALQCLVLWNRELQSNLFDICREGIGENIPGAKQAHSFEVMVAQTKT